MTCTLSFALDTFYFCVYVFSVSNRGLVIMQMKRNLVLCLEQQPSKSSSLHMENMQNRHVRSVPLVKRFSQSFSYKTLMYLE